MRCKNSLSQYCLQNQYFSCSVSQCNFLSFFDYLWDPNQVQNCSFSEPLYCSLVFGLSILISNIFLNLELRTSKAFPIRF